MCKKIYLLKFLKHNGIILIILVNKILYLNEKYLLIINFLYFWYYKPIFKLNLILLYLFIFSGRKKKEEIIK